MMIMMKFIHATMLVFVAFLLSLVACSSSSSSSSPQVGTPIAAVVPVSFVLVASVPVPAVLAARATVAPEIPQFPRVSSHSSLVSLFFFILSSPLFFRYKLFV